MYYLKANTKGESLGKTLADFIHNFGAPEHLTFDGHQLHVGKNTRFYKGLRKYNIEHVSVPRRPDENLAEGTIRELKPHFYSIMRRKQVLKCLWDYHSVVL